MLEHEAHAMISDNARGIAKTATFCDQTRRTQRHRLHTLQHLHEQQMGKLSLLDDRRKSRQGSSTHGGMSNRQYQDLQAGISNKVANSKERERQRAAKHGQLMKVHDSAKHMHT